MKMCLYMFCIGIKSTGVPVHKRPASHLPAVKHFFNLTRNLVASSLQSLAIKDSLRSLCSLLCLTKKREAAGGLALRHLAYLKHVGNEGALIFLFSLL